MWNQRRKSKVSSSLLLLLLLAHTPSGIKIFIFYPELNKLVLFSQLFFKDAFQKVAETFGGMDIFCNNAGILNEIEWQKMISINLVRKCDAPDFF